MSPPPNVAQEILLDTQTYGPRIALITISRESKLNALTQDHYFRISCLLNEVARMDSVVVTVLTGQGRFFSAGADVSISRSPPEAVSDPREYWLKSFVANNIHTTHAFSTHPKVLITALNGPTVGLSAALTAHSDFIYSTPHAYLLTPFSSLGLVTEGGAALALVKRLGVSKANEALLMSRKVDASTMLATGYVNRIFSEGGGDKDTGKGCDSQKFLERVMAEVNEMLGDHLNKESLLGIKKMVKSLDEGRMEKVGVREVMAGLERFVGGAPQREFEAIRKGEKRHKL